MHLKRSGEMAKTNSVNNQDSTSDTSLYTKRTCSDNSELFITSKLNLLYKQALSTKNLHTCRRNLKKMIEVNHLDEKD